MVKNRGEMTAVVTAVRKTLCLSVVGWVRLKKGKAAEGREREREIKQEAQRVKPMPGGVTVEYSFVLQQQAFEFKSDLFSPLRLNVTPHVH